MSSLREAALLYASKGWAVFPLQPRGKEPLTAHGFKDATTEAHQVEAWWDMWPDANVGLACGASGFFVIDVDIRNGGDTNLSALLEEQGAEPFSTLTA